MADYIEDDGTMPRNVDDFEAAIVGHKIVEVSRVFFEDHWRESGLQLTLDNGRRVTLYDTDDCCAYTQLNDVIEHLPMLDHIITGVDSTDDFEEWYILCDFGMVMELKVGWSCGNPFYYGYGFSIHVEDLED